MANSKFLFWSLLLPILTALMFYHLDTFDPAPLPSHLFTTHTPVSAPKKNNNFLNGAEKIGVGRLLAPEDVVYDHASGVIYTGCHDGWVKKVVVGENAAEEVVVDWVNTGGRPLGLAVGGGGDVVVADTDKGLLKISSDGAIEVLVDEAEGLKFGLTDAVVIAKSGIMYFTDATYKYSFHKFIWDFLEGRPYGRLMSYDPSTKQTKVIARDLYFANGVALSPDEDFIICCETPLKRCKKYYIQGEKEGSTDIFIDSLPGFPDNIRYDGEGLYWIAFSSEITYEWKLAQRHPFIRKVLGIMERYYRRPHMERNGGTMAVDVDGKPVEQYFDPEVSMISTGIKIGDQLYLGCLSTSYIIRLNLTQYPAV